MLCFSGRIYYFNAFLKPSAPYRESLIFYSISQCECNISRDNDLSNEFIKRDCSSVKFSSKTCTRCVFDSNLQYKAEDFLFFSLTLFA